MSSTRTRTSLTIDLDLPSPTDQLVPLPDEPGDVVCRGLLDRDGAMIELGVADDDRRETTVYLVAVDHCTHLSPAEARAAACHLLRAADAAELRPQR